MFLTAEKHAGKASDLRIFGTKISFAAWAWGCLLGEQRKRAIILSSVGNERGGVRRYTVCGDRLEAFVPIGKVWKPWFECLLLYKML